MKVLGCLPAKIELVDLVNRKKNKIAAVLMCLIVFFGFAVFQAVTVTPELPDGVSESQYDQAGEALRGMLQREPDHIDRLMFLAEYSVQSGKPEIAANCFEAIPIDHAEYGLSARLQEGQVRLKLNQSETAVKCFTEYLSHVRKADEGNVKKASDEHLVTAYNQLNYILSVQIRLEDRSLWLNELHKRGLADVFDSMQYYFPGLLMWSSASGSGRLAEFLEYSPDSRVLRTAKGRYLTANGELTQSQSLLAELWNDDTQDLMVSAALLECCYYLNDWQTFRTVHSVLPPSSDDEPWLLTRMRGEFHLHEENWALAEQEFLDLLERDPSNPEGHMGLSTALQQQGKIAESQEIRNRSVLISKVRVDLSAVREKASAVPVILEVVEVCEQLNWHEAADTFRHHAERLGTR